MFQGKPREDKSPLPAPWAWLSMWTLNAIAFTLLLNALFSLHLAHMAGWSNPETHRFSRIMFVVLAMATLITNSVWRGRVAPRRSLKPPRPDPPQPPQTTWDLAWRVTACLMGLILICAATSRQPMVPNWCALALSLAGFYGVTALAFWWYEKKLPPPAYSGTPAQALTCDPFLSRPTQGVLVFRRPRWTSVFLALTGLMFAAPAVYLAFGLANGATGMRISPASAFLCLLFYGAFASLFFSMGYDVEMRFELRDRTYRRTPTFWGIHRRGRTGDLGEIAGLRLSQTYSARNPIWVQVVWRDQSRPTESLTMVKDADVAREQIRSLAETLDLAILPPVFEREWRTRR